MKNQKTLIAMLIASALATGCGSLKYSTGFEIDSSTQQAEAAPGVEVAYPEWYNEDLEDDDVNLYAVASEYSKDMQFALDKASLSAKRELASNFSSHIDSMLKDYATEVGDLDTTVIREIDRTTKLVVARVNLIGVQRTNMSIVHSGEGGYRAYVKLKYTPDSANAFILSEVRKNAKLMTKFNASKRFAELEEGVALIEEQKIEELQILSGDLPPLVE
jgi:hypothetical protein|tara:strand:- start:655 stop:1308 length:654 start_codon:yes stop_codon:yes gene_type:complete